MLLLFLQAGAGGYVCARKGCSGQVSGGEVEKTLQVITAVLDQALELLDMDRPGEETCQPLQRHHLDSMWEC